MLLTSIVASGLALIDAMLAYFVTVTVSPGENICGTVWYVYNAQLTTCGQEHIVAELMTDLLELMVLPRLLEALFAV